MSVIDEYELNKDNFEKCIAHCLKMPQLLIIFRKDSREMDEWCKKEYGTNFLTTYEILRQIAIEKFTETLSYLSMRGNNTALNIIDRFLNEAQQDKVVKVVFDNNLKTETEEDKENG